METGHFERGLSALTAAGALVTAAEIYFEHDSASFGNTMMWVPVALGPFGAAAGLAGFFSRRMAKTALPVASAAIVANGVQGVYLHARGIAQKPGGWRNVRYNMEMGPVQRHAGPLGIALDSTPMRLPGASPVTAEPHARQTITKRYTCALCPVSSRHLATGTIGRKSITAP